MAITFVETQGTAAQSGGTANLTFNTSCAVGDLIVAMWLQATAASSGVTVSDNKNTGNYAPALAYFNATQQVGVYLNWIECTASGAPTVTISGLNSANTAYLMIAHYNGFVHGPLPVTADLTTNNGSGTAVTGTSFLNSNAHELLLAIWADGGADNGTASPSNWTAENTNASFSYWDWVIATSGNNITFSQTQTASSGWVMGLVGFYDGTPSGGPLPPGSILT